MKLARGKNGQRENCKNLQKSKIYKKKRPRGRLSKKIDPKLYIIINRIEAIQTELNPS